MEETGVLIIGAGPTGLALAVTLGRMGINAIILEKELVVNEDPRDIAIIGDAVRTLHQLGIGDALTSKIGQDFGTLYFHHKNFISPPFMNFDMAPDWLEQSVPGAISQFQPNFERELRLEIAKFPSLDLRSGCEVIDRTEEPETVVVEYKDRDGEIRELRAKWLVGADGKGGVVRKRFLEPEGIKQQIGLFKYEATWVAANFKITSPTPETHPQFPLWELRYTPEEVYELFWPSGFHFCNDPRRPAVSGRFGPQSSNFWRHEYSVEDGDSTEDPLNDLWKQFGPWLRLPKSRFNGSLNENFVEFPRDCIDVLRCRSFRFAVKVANRWFCRKTIILGDAAHIFPPFGGQGIAAGIRDARALGWRLGMMEHAQLSPESEQNLLIGWSHEQRQRADESTRATMVNGSIVNRRSAVLAFVHRMMMRLLWIIPGMPAKLTSQAFRDRTQLTRCENGFFLPESGGGRKLSQIWIQSQDGSPQLSDRVILRQDSKLALLVLIEEATEVRPAEMKQMLKEADLGEEVLSLSSVTFLCRRPKSECDAVFDEISSPVFYPCTRVELVAAGINAIKGYDETSLKTRLDRSAKFVVVRPDFFVHSVAKNAEEFQQNAKELRRAFYPSIDVRNQDGSNR